MTYEVVSLPYDYAALEPHFDAQTVELHYEKHHKGYAQKLSAAVALADERGYLLHGKKFSEYSVEELLMHINVIPESVVDAIANNGGGVVNHNLFWQCLSPQGGGSPSGSLLEAIEESFGSFDEFKLEFSDAAKTHFGSGWAWLVINHEGGLEVIATPNQDSPLMTGLIPILGLDVWEHSYYLRFMNRRPDYVDAFWNIVNWAFVSGLYEKNV